MDRVLVEFGGQVLINYVQSSLKHNSSCRVRNMNEPSLSGKIHISSVIQHIWSPAHSPLSTDHRPSTLRLGDFLTRGKGTSCAAGSGGTSRGDRGRGSRGGTEAWAGSSRLCSPVPGTAPGAADLGLCLRKAAGSLLSAEADHGTSPPAEIVCVPAVKQLRCAALNVHRKLQALHLVCESMMEVFIKTLILDMHAHKHSSSAAPLTAACILSAALPPPAGLCWAFSHDCKKDVH